MKKIGILLLAVFVTALVITSCSQKDCPAYSKADSEQAGRNV